MLKHYAAAVGPAFLLLAVFVQLLTSAGTGLAAEYESVRPSPWTAMPAETASDAGSAAPRVAEPGEEAAATPKADENGDAEPAAALDRLFSRDYHACMDAAAGVTVAMQECMNAEVERLEKHLAEQRARLVPTLSEERAKALNDALLAWENLRKYGSAAMYDPDGGTLAPLISSLWHLEQTARMARWLDEMQESAAP